MANATCRTDRSIGTTPGACGATARGASATGSQSSLRWGPGGSCSRRATQRRHPAAAVSSSAQPKRLLGVRANSKAGRRVWRLRLRHSRADPHRGAERSFGRRPLGGKRRHDRRASGHVRAADGTCAPSSAGNGRTSISSICRSGADAWRTRGRRRSIR